MLNQPHIDYAGPAWHSTQTGARKEEKSFFSPNVKIIVFFIFWLEGHGKLQTTLTLKKSLLLEVR